VGNVIGYSGPGSASGAVFWGSGVAGGIENSSLNVAMRPRRLVWWVPATMESKSRTCWNLGNGAKPQERLKTTRAEQVAAILAQLPKSGADRDGDPGVGYGPRRECKFDLANQKNNESPVAENRPQGLRWSPPPEYPRAAASRTARRRRPMSTDSAKPPRGPTHGIHASGRAERARATHGSVGGEKHFIPPAPQMVGYCARIGFPSEG
jgi:hypothetical protein